MICPRCGTSNREGATYCDSCGDQLKPGAEPLVVEDDSDEEGDEPTLLERGGLGSWMAADWLIRFIIVGVVGLLAGIWTLTIGQYGFSLFFFLLFIVGVVGARWVANAK